jgi:elongation factor Ts
MHIAATDPRFVSRDEVTEADLEREKDIYRSQAAASGKPPNIVEKMLEGKLGKFYEEFCLLDQPFIKDQSQTIAQIIATKVAKLGENISVRRFARFKVGAPEWTVAQTKIAGGAAGVDFAITSNAGPGQPVRAFFFLATRFARRRHGRCVS